MTLLTIVLLRSLERVLAIGVGSLLAYLGYRLFIAVPTAQDGEGRFTLPSGAGIHLSRVGPGVFFSLFGTAIVALSFLQLIDYRETIPIQNDESGPAVARAYSGVGASGGVSDPEEFDRLRARVLGDIYVLNTFYKGLRPDLSEEQQGDLGQTLLRAKLTLMKSVWGEDWGDDVMFEAWVLHAQETAPPPPELSTAAMVFHRGLKGRHE